jgi:hypothetical protein
VSCAKTGTDDPHIANSKRASETVMKIAVRGGITGSLVA